MAVRKRLKIKQTDELLKAMLVLARTVEHVLQTRAVEAAGESLSRSKTQILRLLARRGPQSSTEVAQFLGISKPGVTQIVNAMVASKLVKRKVVKSDRRSSQLELMAKGRSVFEAIQDEQRHLARSTFNQSAQASVEPWIEMLHEVTGALASADSTFTHFCLQCGAHANKTCILTGGDAVCLFSSQRDKSRTRAKRGPASAR